MITAHDLQFSEIGGAAPRMTCNLCALSDDATGWLMAEIPIDESGDTYNIVVCSKACEVAFKNHPMAAHYIARGINNARQVKAGGHS